MLMAHSNNFVANQILITTGVAVDGPPGSLRKGVQTVLDYANQQLGIKNVILVEGSGICRENRMSPHNMVKILNIFEPYHDLMRKADNTFYKTGTLKGIQTRAGYIADSHGLLYRFAVFINTPGKSINRVMDRILAMTYR